MAAGQTLFVDRRTGVNYTAPAAGIVSAIERGPRRTLRSVVIRVDGERDVEFPSYDRAELATLAPDAIRDNLLKSGLWTAFRTRPYNRNPDPGSTPHAMFVTAIDTEPLAADPAVVIAEYAGAFADGLALVARLFDVDTYVCTAAAANVVLPDVARLKPVTITGPHPAGLVGTHIHHLDPVGARKTVWHLNYQDVIAIGRLFAEGRLWRSRIVALGGPPVVRPRLLPVAPGGDIADIVAGELHERAVRLISGSVLSGRGATGQERFLGRYHMQVSVLDEAADASHANAARARGRFSFMGILERLKARGAYDFDTAVNGRTRPLIPFGQFERVMPLDILATPLLRSLLIGDVESASALGCLELAEEDLALCEFVCSSKHNYGSALRHVLGEIEAGRT